MNPSPDRSGTGVERIAGGIFLKKTKAVLLKKKTASIKKRFRLGYVM